MHLRGVGVMATPGLLADLWRGSVFVAFAGEGLRGGGVGGGRWGERVIGLLVASRL